VCERGGFVGARRQRAGPGFGRGCGGVWASSQSLTAVIGTPPVSPPGQLKTDPTTKITTQSILPFTSLNNPTGVTLDSQGNLYVVDTGNDRNLKLAKAFAAQ
jgi:hypothetical protein